MSYNDVLKAFKVEWDHTYQYLRDQAEPDVLLINDRDNDHKVIKWAPIFLDCLTCSYGIYGTNGPLAYILSEEPVIPTEIENPLENDAYYGVSGSLR